MFQNQKKLRNFLYTFLILFTVFQACKPKYQEEIKPLENPALALSKKASVWWQNKQSQPKPQRRDGEKQPPDYITTFYPNWSKATHHHTTNQQTKVIVPLLRNAKAWYFYPTIRRAVFTLNPDSSVADAQIIEIITNSNELLNKYETQLFLNPDATNLKDFTGYVLEYDVQYTRTKFTGYTNGIIAKDNASIATDGGQGNTNWDCGDNNPIDTNPADPSNNNPPNGSGGATNWVIFIGGTPGSSPGSNTSGNLLGPPLNPMTTISGNFGGGGYSGVVTPTIIQPIQLADVGGAAAQMGDIGGLIPGGSVDVGDPIESEILERKTHDTGDSRKNNGNPCGNSGGGQSYTSDNFPGKDDGWPFEWWKDEQWMQQNLKFSLDDDEFGLTAQEMILCALNPFAANKMAKNRDIAIAKTNSFVANGILSQPLNGKADAFRHCFFNAMNARDIGVSLAMAFGDAHESETKPGLELEKEMDLYNNYKGVYEVFSNAPTSNPSNSYLAQTVLEFVADGKLKYLSPLDFLVSPEYPNGKNGITNQTQLIPTNQ